ncbi:MAG: hypothetical protein AAB869_03320 [Patescibacteria group bacterium]
MKRIFAVLLFAFASIVVVPAHASNDENSLVGVYNGRFAPPGKDLKFDNVPGMRIEIQSQKGETITGVATFYGIYCVGEFSFSGTATGSSLQFVTVATDRCYPKTFRLSREGKILKGEFTVTMKAGGVVEYTVKVSK